MNDKEKSKPKTYTIIVNGTEEVIEEKEITFEQLVVFAYGEISDNPLIIYTITYLRGTGNKPEGSMLRGDSVKVKDGMIFSVTKTDRS